MASLPTRKNIQKFKANNKFINMLNHIGINKSTVVFQISILNLLNNYPKMKKSSLFLHFLRNNFEIITIFVRKY